MRETRLIAARTSLGTYQERFARYADEAAELERRQAQGRGLTVEQHTAEMGREAEYDAARKARTPLQIRGEIEQQLGGALSEMMFTSFDPRSKAQAAALTGARHWVEKYRAAAKDGETRPAAGVIFHGANGCGKTHLAASMLRSVTDPLITIRFANVPEFLQEMRDSFADGPGSEGSRWLHKCKLADVLVLDDLGQERATEWVVDTLGSLIFHRDRKALPTIITTNLGIKEFADRAAGSANAAGVNLGAIYSRLRGQTHANAFVLDGGDHRTEAAV